MKRFLVIFYAFGFTSIAAGSGFAVYNVWFLLVAEKTTGTVISTSEIWRDKTDTDQQRRNNVSTIDYTSNVVDVEFFDTSSKRHIVMFDISEDILEEGERISLVYRFRMPENAKIATFRKMFLGPIILIFFGGIFWFVGKLGFIMLE